MTLFGRGEILGERQPTVEVTAASNCQSMLKEEDCTIHFDVIFSAKNNIFERSPRQLSHKFGLIYRLEACNSAIDAHGLDLAGFFGIEKILKV